MPKNHFSKNPSPTIPPPDPRDNAPLCPLEAPGPPWGPLGAPGGPWNHLGAPWGTAQNLKTPHAGIPHQPPPDTAPRAVPPSAPRCPLVPPAGRLRPPAPPALLLGGLANPPYSPGTPSTRFCSPRPFRKYHFDLQRTPIFKNLKNKLQMDLGVLSSSLGPLNLGVAPGRALET